jgi:hypothetical protein
MINVNELAQSNLVGSNLNNTEKNNNKKRDFEEKSSACINQVK